MRFCKTTKKRIFLSKTEARKASRGPHRMVKVDPCPHCDGYHVRRLEGGEDQAPVEAVAASVESQGGSQ